MGSSFTKLCEFFTVIQEVAVVYSIEDGTPIVDRVPVAFAEAKYQKILAWADSLGRDMAWDQNSQEHVMLFQCLVCGSTAQFSTSSVLLPKAIKATPSNPSPPPTAPPKTSSPPP
ncbi:hypothetical protein ACKRZS_007667 [Fusarium odoratissimum]